MKIIKKILGMQPQDSTRKKGAFIPSKFCFNMFGKNFSSELPLKQVNPKNKKCNPGETILVIGTSSRDLKMANGTIFDTGHNVGETLIPMFHLDAAGYRFEISTQDGKPFALESWAWIGPKKRGIETHLRGLYDKVGKSGQWDSPITTKEAYDNLKSGKYSAIFVPGGHGVMIDLGKPIDGGHISSILSYSHENKFPLISLCHGLNILSAAPKGTYDGYNVCGFPDIADRQSEIVGYLPGQLTEMMEEELEKVGVTLKNKKPDKSTHVENELITGASPSAAHNLGKLAVEILLGS